MTDTNASSKPEDPLSSLRGLYNLLTGGLDVRPVDISRELPRHPKKRYDKRSLSQVDMVVIHTTDKDWSIQELAKFDIGPNHISSTGCPGPTYHDVVMKQGTVFHCLPYEEVSWHAGGYNTRSVAVALMYQCTDIYTKKDSYGPTSSAMKALICQLGKLCLKFGLTPYRVVGHRELKGTGWFWKRGHKRLRKTCPGLQIDLDNLRSRVALYMQIFLRLEGHYNGEVDGIWNSECNAALKLYKCRSSTK